MFEVGGFMFKKNLGYLYIMIAAALWGTIGVVVKTLISMGFTTISIVIYRIAVSFLILFIIIFLYDRSLIKVKKEHLVYFVLYGLISVSIFNIVYINAIDLTTVTTAVILLYTSPVFVLLISRVLFNEKIDFVKFLCAVFTFIGCFLVVKGYNIESLKLNFKGIILGILSGLTYGLYSIFGKYCLKDYKPYTVSLYSLGFGSLFLSLYLILTGTKIVFIPKLIPNIVLLYIILFPTLLSYVFYTKGLKLIEAGKASIVATVEPVVSSLLAVFVLGESLEFIQVLGIVMVLMAVVLIQRK